MYLKIIIIKHYSKVIIIGFVGYKTVMMKRDWRTLHILAVIVSCCLSHIKKSRTFITNIIFYCTVKKNYIFEVRKKRA